jgi:cytochrome c553
MPTDAPHTIFRFPLLLAAVIALAVAAGAFADDEAATDATAPADPPGLAATTPAPRAVAPPPESMPVGRAADGRKAYEVCAVCHLDTGAGRPDGVFPQLAGQHASVIYRQIADIRDGRRENPIMYPFARTLTDSQVIADLAAYIESLPFPPDNGKGPGGDYPLGAKLYTRDCASCHGERGRGSAERLVPLIASQHYAYVARQIDDIVGRHRGNADPKMVEVVSHYSPQERAAVADYISRLEETPQLVPAPEAAGE